jgi:hypothetical protein
MENTVSFSFARVASRLYNLFLESLDKELTEQWMRDIAK